MHRGGGNRHNSQDGERRQAKFLVEVLKSPLTMKIDEELIWRIPARPQFFGCEIVCYMYMHICVSMCIHIYIYAYLHMYMYAHIFIYIYTHVYMCRQKFFGSNLPNPGKFEDISNEARRIFEVCVHIYMICGVCTI